MSHYLLDTNQLSAAVFWDRSIVREEIVRRHQAGHRIGVSVLVLCELQPVLLSRPRALIYQRILRQLLKRIRVWPVESNDIERYGDLFLKLRQLGKQLSFVDVVLAATSLERGHILVTSDRDFEGVPQLVTENWSSI